VRIIVQFVDEDDLILTEGDFLILTEGDFPVGVSGLVGVLEGVAGRFSCVGDGSVLS
jgi:hypothetical protein